MSEPLSETHEGRVAGQFGPRARAYVESAVHAQGADLEALQRRLVEACPQNALDLGTGGGHVAYLLAAHARQAVAVDLSPDMLRAVAAQAESRGLANLSTVEATAEDLPFADASFDFLASRFSAHHWRDFGAGLRQARRVLRAGAPAIFIDVVAPGLPLFDTHLQTIESLRDPSHARDYALAEWMQALAQARLSVQACQTWRLRMDFGVWTERMATPELLRQAIRALQAAAADDSRAYFAIESDGSFLLDVAMIETTAF
jgi:SAM-dependent methyltransferase